MIQTAIDYAKELHKAGMTHEELSSVKDIFDVVPQVKEELNDPTVSLEKKHLVIQKVFSKNVRNFLQLLCDNNDVNLFEEVYKALTNYGYLCINDLDKEDGSFHKKHNNDGVFHYGFDKDVLKKILINNGFKIVDYKIVLVDKREDREFPIFNLIAQK